MRVGRSGRAICFVRCVNSKTIKQAFIKICPCDGRLCIVSIVLRLLSFLVFRKHSLKYASYLGKVLSPAIIGIMMIYCLKDISLVASPFGIPELLACAFVAGIQAWRRDALLSILAGTVLYMLFVQVVF